MQMKSFVTSTLLAVGLLTGCGGVEAEAEVPVQALSACTDRCDRFFDRCIYYENNPTEECAEYWYQCMDTCAEPAVVEAK